MTRPPDGPTGPGEVAAQISHCYRHPNREALVRCTRCERPICPDCMRPASVGFHCPDDLARDSKAVRPQRSAVGARLRQSPPYVTGVLIALNVAVYLWTGTHSVYGINDPHGAPLFTDWQLQPISVHSGGRYYELITSAFLHVNLLHIGSNMLALAIIGPPLEQVLGRWRFGAIYLIGGLGGGAAVYAFGAPLQPVVGASGAIFGLFGASLLMVRRLGLDPQWLIGIVVLNFVLTFSIPDISKLGHVGGFVTGLLTGLAIAGLPKARQRLEARLQVAGLAAVAGVVAAVIVIRTATW